MLPNHSIIPGPRRALAAVLLLAAALPIRSHAQEMDSSAVSRGGWSLRRTMGVFIDGLGDEFFPRRGDWTYVPTTEQADGSRVTGIHRFPAAQTSRAMDPGGPICDSFSMGESVRSGTLREWSMAEKSGLDRPWRRVGTARFVPPGAPANSPVFVQWRREDGQWVIDSYGEWRRYWPSLPGRLVNEVVADAHRSALRLPLAATERMAPGTAWFDSNQPIVVLEHHFTRYGLPRQLKEGDIVRYGSLGEVGVYVEPRVEGFPQIVYIPVDRSGLFQPYENMSGNGCEH
jgi:hypothetical protein